MVDKPTHEKLEPDKQVDFPGKIKTKSILLYGAVIALIWTLSIMGFLVWNIQKDYNNTRDLALREARTNINKDQIIRHWAASQGGVYVFVDDNISPNPLLSHIPERDIKAPSGRILTLMPFAYITRRLMEYYNEEYGIKGRITSLKPLRPENAPDEWEKKALESFEKRAEEVSEFTEIDGKPYLRLIRPMITEEKCLECHGHQGYKVGDIRGGIGVSLPMSSLLDLEQEHIKTEVVSHMLILFLGLIGIGLGTKKINKDMVKRRWVEEELANHQQYLEDLVDERTAELTDANAHLTQEIAEREQAQEALMLGNQRFKSISNSSQYGLFLLDEETKVSYVNKFAEGWFGPSREIVGRFCWEIFKLKDPEKNCAGMKAVRTGKTVQSDTLTEVLHGEKKSFYVIASPVFDRAGKVCQVAETVIDITERKKVEEELAKHQQYLEELVKERTAELTEANEHLVQEIADRKRVEKELKKYHDHLEELVRKRTADLEETQQSLLSVLNDVNKAKEELKQAHSRLMELDHLKSMFIASMSHELRTPLNSIIGFTGVILQGMAGDINDEQKDQLQRVYNSAKHLLALVSDIIDISKVEAGKIKPYIEEFQLDEIIEEVALNLKKQIEDKGLTLKTNIPQSIKLTTDKRRLIQCVLNFLSNAIKFTQKGRISIAAGETAGMVEISVKDSGIGIKKEDVPKLFNSFVRLDSPLKTTILGTGLGLYLTKKIAMEILGGAVSVESKYGKGSTFTLTISKEISAKKKSEA